jgi:arsenate reductase (thioredoxin)
MLLAMEARRVLFVCTHNSARSQMAEAFLRFHGHGKFEAFSAGTEATAVRPEAIAAMAELGIDISGQQSKTFERYLGEPFEWVITVCDRARQTCPVFPGADNTDHWGFDDPAEAEGSDEDRLAVFRRVRDEINARIKIFVLTAGRKDLPVPATTSLGAE